VSNSRPRDEESSSWGSPLFNGESNHELFVSVIYIVFAISITGSMTFVVRFYLPRFGRSFDLVRRQVASAITIEVSDKTSPNMIAIRFIRSPGFSDGLEAAPIS
jgi:hypothetical protein